MYVTRPLELTNGKIYDVISIERDWYRIETDMLGDYLFPPGMFEIVEIKPDNTTQKRQEAQKSE